MHDTQRFFGNAHRRCDFGGLIVHKHHIRRFNGRVGAKTAHCDSDIRAGEYRCIIDTIPDKSELSVCALLLQQLFHALHLIRGQQFRVYLVQAELLCNTFSYGLRIACEHDRFADALPLQRSNRTGRVRLYCVGNHDVSGIFAVYRHMNDGTCLVTFMPLRADFIH